MYLIKQAEHAPALKWSFSADDPSFLDVPNCEWGYLHSTSDRCNKLWDNWVNYIYIVRQESNGKNQTVNFEGTKK